MKSVLVKIIRVGILCWSLALYSKPTAIDNAIGSVGTITTNTNQGTARGSGFITDFNGLPYFVTNQHVVAGASEITVIMYDGKTIKFNLNFAEASPTQDLVRFVLQPKLFPSTSRIDRRTPNLTIGSPVVALGNSEGREVVERLSGKIVNIGGKVIEVSCPIVHGCSGGPIIDTNGKLIAVSTYSWVRKYCRTVLEEKYYGMAINDNTVWTITGDEFVNQSKLYSDLSLIVQQISTFLSSEESSVWIEKYKFDKQFLLIENLQFRAGVIAYFKNEEICQQLLLHINTVHDNNRDIKEIQDMLVDMRKTIYYKKIAIDGIITMINNGKIQVQNMKWSSEYLKKESQDQIEELLSIRAFMKIKYDELMQLERSLNK